MVLFRDGVALVLWVRFNCLSGAFNILPFSWFVEKRSEMLYACEQNKKWVNWRITKFVHPREKHVSTSAYALCFSTTPRVSLAQNRFVLFSPTKTISFLPQAQKRWLPSAQKMEEILWVKVWIENIRLSRENHAGAAFFLSSFSTCNQKIFVIQ